MLKTKIFKLNCQWNIKPLLECGAVKLLLLCYSYENLILCIRVESIKGKTKISHCSLWLDSKARGAELWIQPS